MALYGDDPRWVLELDYDFSMSIFTLNIDGDPFLSLPTQAFFSPTGCQQINAGSIEFNGEEIHSG